MEETPPSKPLLNGFSKAAANLDPHTLFLNLEGCNVGFKRWHPMPVSGRGAKLSGQGEMGGVWEWTSSVLEKQEDHEPMELYPGYSGKFITLKLFLNYNSQNRQPTSSTRSTTSFLVDPGRHIQGSQDVNLCEYLLPVRFFESLLIQSSVNWYQRNYPYVWAGARVVRDARVSPGS